MEQIIHIDEDDVLICISFPRYSTKIVQAVKFARSRKASVISITDSVNSPLAKYSKLMLTATSDIASFVDSLVAPLSLINALIVSLGLRKKSQVAEHFKDLEELWAEYNVYIEVDDKETKTKNKGTKLNNICVIGGGAAGCMAAIAAAKSSDVTILERNEKLLKKVFITGKGRCNVTNAAVGEDFLKNVVRGQKFYLSSFYNFDNFAVMDFFEDRNCPLKEERGSRMFPVSDKSSDIIKTLEKELKEKGVSIRLNYDVKSIKKDGNKFIINDSLTFDKVIVTAGGASYKSTGSDGNMYRKLEKLGHTINDISPSLSALTTSKS